MRSRVSWAGMEWRDVEGMKASDRGRLTALAAWSHGRQQAFTDRAGEERTRRRCGPRRELKRQTTYLPH